MSRNYLTQEGFDKIKKELDHLKSIGRREAAIAIGEAREKGDLSENAEYDAAKDAQGHLEARISHLEGILASSTVISADQIDLSTVQILNKVTIKNIKTKKELTYTLVSESESNIKEKKISVNSPIGSGLLGKEVGDIAQITTPRGSLEFEILNISI